VTFGPVRPNDGPILVTLEYRVAPEHVPTFVALMAERRRTRLRNGALRWRLTRISPTRAASPSNMNARPGPIMSATTAAPPRRRGRSPIGSTS
jgi:hypothetical protein